jgi:flagellar motor protein MotB
MSDLSNALQGKLNSSRKSHVKDPSERQLDLFSSLTDRASPGRKILPLQEKSTSGPPVEPERALPPTSGTPPDVMADVRSVLSESDQARADDGMPENGVARPPLRTGIYHRPRRPAAPPAPALAASPPPRRPSGPRVPPFQRIGDWFAGVEMDRRMVSLVVVLVLLVAIAAFWTACPRNAPAPGTLVDLSEIQLPAPKNEPATEASAPVAAVSPPASAPAPAAVAVATDWKVPGTEATLNGGAVRVRFTDPVFISTDKISIEGMRALKAVAAKLVTLKTPARVIVTGYTDDVPLSKPTPQLQSNADLAAARTQRAIEHLLPLTRANKGLSFEARTGEPSQAPYPNDSSQHRRLNRTVTVQVIPAP